MAMQVAEFFGYRADDLSQAAREAAIEEWCPFLADTCTKTLSDGTISGVCTIKPSRTESVVCCPVRLYADDYQILQDVADTAFGVGTKLIAAPDARAAAVAGGTRVVAVFGKRWGKELRLPQRSGKGGYFVDWILALLAGDGSLEEFVAIEVQTIDTTGNYRDGRAALLATPRSTVGNKVGLNWENVSKRILPQLIFKAQVLQRDSRCKKGLFFVCPTPVYSRVIDRLGGSSGVVRVSSLQPSSVTFLGYALDTREELIDGQPVAIYKDAEHRTTVAKVQEAFNNINLPDEDVYGSAIDAALG